MGTYIGIDVGATTTAAGLVGDDGTIVSVIQRCTRNDARDTILAVAHTLVGEARTRGLVVDGVGIGLPGVVDTAAGAMVAGSFLPDLVDVPLADLLRAATGLPVFVDNDANVLALGERAFGVARDAASLALFAVGTGLGGAVMLGDTLVRGHAGCAGEFGHVPVKFDGPECACGRRGCAGAWMGGRAIAARAREARLGRGEPPDIDARLVFEAARAGDRLAQQIVDEACGALGAGIAAVMHAVNPEVIVVTGGVAASLVPLERELRACVARHALPRTLATTRLCIVPGDKRRTVAGGAALVRYEREGVRM